MLHDPLLIVVLFADFIDYIQVNLCYNYGWVASRNFCQLYNFRSIHVQRF